MAAVTTGARSGDMVEILEGLKENDRVFILTPGEKESGRGDAAR